MIVVPTHWDRFEHFLYMYVIQLSVMSNLHTGVSRIYSHYTRVSFSS